MQYGRGVVWECEVAPREADELAARFTVGNLHYGADGLAVVRLVAEAPSGRGRRWARRAPAPTARSAPPGQCRVAMPVEPTLEDVYLYLFQESSGDGTLLSGDGVPLWRVGVVVGRLHLAVLVEEGSELAADPNGRLTYTRVEQAFWLSRYDKVPKPVEYGYAGGWDDVLNCLGFLLFGRADKSSVTANNASRAAYPKPTPTTAVWAQYGYAGGWDDVLNCLGFLLFAMMAVVLACAPVFTAERRARAAAPLARQCRWRRWPWASAAAPTRAA